MRRSRTDGADMIPSSWLARECPAGGVHGGSGIPPPGLSSFGPAAGFLTVGRRHIEGLNGMSIRAWVKRLFQRKPHETVADILSAARQCWPGDAPADVIDTYRAGKPSVPAVIGEAA
jgi:hypothetical protein